MGNIWEIFPKTLTGKGFHRMTQPMGRPVLGVKNLFFLFIP
jgi:hypothetical protein